MTETDRKIKALGYEVRVCDLMCNYIVYENKKDDEEVIIEWDDDKEICCKIFAQTISRVKTWEGHAIQIPNALTIQEALLFVAKIDEMRKES